MSDLLPTRKGISWPVVIKIIKWISPFVILALMAYARTLFVSRDEYLGLDKTMQTHISASDMRLHSLEEFRSRDEPIPAQLTAIMKQIGEEQAAQKSLLNTIQASQERVLNRLDTISDRQVKNSELLSAKP